ncbi:MAG TPA: hypoxanthine phosphoribosyltransferase [Saprospiraceae bacterium]|nr:hypoxanthine phosphoribosyltransferase [Saprospiraceae bacterium]HNG88748.1 hypoxanthine phosphoribosyltransferase [Saprospiraceae bacterium]
MTAQPTLHIRDLQFESMLSEAQVQTRVRELGQALTERLAGKAPLFISILSGAFVFASDLIRAFESECEVGFVKLASYVGTRSSGDVQTVMGLQKDLAGRHLVVVEDIVDTGRTLHFFLDHLRQQQPASICTVTFLRKPEAAQFDVQVDFVGFDIEDKFVVGYGLDYDGLGRNLPGVYQMVP